MLRKIKTREEIDKKRKRNQFIVGSVLIFLLVVSTLGYSLMNRDVVEDNSVSENGFDFIRDGGLWKIEFNGGVFGFQYLPSRVSNVSVSGFYNFEDYANEVLYFVNSGEGKFEILNNLGNYVLRYQDACVGQVPGWEGGGEKEGGKSCEGDLPFKDCSDNLIIFESGDETRVWKNESCVYISGDAVKGADAFLYKVLKMD